MSARALKVAPVLGVSDVVKSVDYFCEARGRMDTDAYFYVSDADALYAEYRPKSVRMVREIENSDYGLRDFLIETPDGHHLLFGSDMAADAG